MMLRTILCAALAVLPPLAAAAQTKEAGAGYRAGLDGLDLCLFQSGEDAGERACLSDAIEACKNAGFYEGCLEAHAAHLGALADLTRRALGLLRDELPEAASACQPDAFAPKALCAAQDAGALLLELRKMTRAEGFDSDIIEAPVFHPRPILDCIAAAGGPARALHCVGEGAQACWHAEAGAGPEGTISICLTYEQAYWDAQIAETLGSFTGDMDAELTALVHQDWETSLYARCELVARLSGSQPGSEVFWHDCITTLTGQHALWLQTLEDRR